MFMLGKVFNKKRSCGFIFLQNCAIHPVTTRKNQPSSYRFTQANQRKHLDNF